MRVNEQRRQPRQRMLKGAKILLNQSSVVDCTVRDLSETGAKLRLPTVIGIPDRFVLVLQDDTRQTCRVVRRTGTELGVAFEEETAECARQAP